MKEGAYFLAGFFSQGIQEAAIVESVKEVIENGKQLLAEFKMVAVRKAAIKSVQKAFEILHDSVGGQEVTDERVNELMEIVEPYIYGSSTPLFRAIKYSVELFSHSEFANHTKMLFILSDGEPSDEDETHPQLQELSRLGVTILSCFITHENISNPRRLYGIPHVTWKEPAKFMFGISSIIKTQDSKDGR